MIDKFCLETSSVCDLRCSFCNYPYLDRHKSILTVNQADRILSHFQEHCSSPIYVCLSGLGEPLLNPYFFDIAKLTREFFPDTWVCANSNCTHLTRDNIRKLIDSSIDAWCCSIRFSNGKDYMKYCKSQEYWIVVERVKQLLAMKGTGGPNVHLQTFKNKGMVRFILQWFPRLNRNDTITFERMVDYHDDSKELMDVIMKDDHILVSDVDGNLYSACLMLWRSCPERFRVGVVPDF